MIDLFHLMPLLKVCWICHKNSLLTKRESEVWAKGPQIILSGAIASIWAHVSAHVPNYHWATSLPPTFRKRLSSNCVKGKFLNAVWDIPWIWNDLHWLFYCSLLNNLWKCGLHRSWGQHWFSTFINKRFMYGRPTDGVNTILQTKKCETY